MAGYCFPEKRALSEKNVLLSIWGDFVKSCQFESLGCLIRSKIFSFHINTTKLSATSHFSKSEFNQVMKAKICFLCSPTFFWFGRATDLTQEGQDDWEWSGWICKGINHANLTWWPYMLKWLQLWTKRAPGMSFMCFSHAFDTGALGAGQEPAVNPASKMSNVIQGCVSRSAAKSSGQGLPPLASTVSDHIWMPWLV